MYKLVTLCVGQVLLENNLRVLMLHFISILQGHYRVEMKNVAYEWVKQRL
mgnify:CR=1 FL=1